MIVQVFVAGILLLMNVVNVMVTVLIGMKVNVIVMVIFFQVVITLVVQHWNLMNVVFVMVMVHHVQMMVVMMVD